MISEVAEVEELKEIVEDLKEPEEKPKKRRGRRKKSEPEQPEITIPVEILTGLVAYPFDVIAQRKGEHWRLTEEEKVQLAMLLNGAMNELLPQIQVKYPYTLGFTFTLAMVILTRIQIDKSLNK